MKLLISFRTKTIPNENVGISHHYEISLYSIFINFALFQESKDPLLIEIMKGELENLSSFKEINPLYFNCRYLLGKAILNSFESTGLDTFSLFEQAIKDASFNKSFMVEAFAYEYFASFLQNSSDHEQYSKYLNEQAFKKWKNMGVSVKYLRLQSFDTILDISDDSSSFTSFNQRTVQTG
jgi:hypothetical protein